jgi:hypothetical protein
MLAVGKVALVNGGTVLHTYGVLYIIIKHLIKEAAGV